MKTKLLSYIAVTAIDAAIAVTTPAMARGGFGGGGGGMHGGGFGGVRTSRQAFAGGFAGRRFAGGFHNSHNGFFRRNRFRNFGFFGAPFFAGYAAYDDYCWRQAWTSYGWRWVDVCYGY